MQEWGNRLFGLKHLGIKNPRKVPWGIKRPPEISLPPSVSPKNQRYLPKEPLKIKL